MATEKVGIYRKYHGTIPVDKTWLRLDAEPLRIVLPPRQASSQRSDEPAPVRAQRQRLRKFADLDQPANGSACSWGRFGLLCLAGSCHVSRGRCWLQDWLQALGHSGALWHSPVSLGARKTRVGCPISVHRGIFDLLSILWLRVRIPSAPFRNHDSVGQPFKSGRESPENLAG